MDASSIGKAPAPSDSQAQSGASSYAESGRDPAVMLGEAMKQLLMRVALAMAAIAVAMLAVRAAFAQSSTSHVLVAGGEMRDPGTGAYVALNTAEIYDSGSGAFTLTGAMTAARKYPTAALLSTGQVLVTGGADSSNTPMASSELYNPATGTFTAAAPINQARLFDTATVLADGRVLIAGGQSIDPATGAIVVLNTAEIYDPSKRTFTLVTCTVGGSVTTACMSSPRCLHTATLLSNGEVLLAGGEANPTGPLMNSAELFNPATNTFSATGSMVEPRGFDTAMLLNDGTVLVAGGPLVNGLDPGAEIYTPASGSFAMVSSSMTTPRFEQTATVLADGKVMLAGGSFSTVVVDLYNWRKGAFVQGGSMTTQRFAHTATLLADSSVLLAGGYDQFGTPMASAELANRRGTSFNSTGAMAYPRAGHIATLLP